MQPINLKKTEHNIFNAYITMMFTVVYIMIHNGMAIVYIRSHCNRLCCYQLEESNSIKLSIQKI